MARIQLTYCFLPKLIIHPYHKFLFQFSFPSFCTLNTGPGSWLAHHLAKPDHFCQMSVQRSESAKRRAVIKDMAYRKMVPFETLTKSCLSSQLDFESIEWQNAKCQNASIFERIYINSYVVSFAQPQ